MGHRTGRAVTSTDVQRHEHGAVFWVATTAGAVIVAFGIRGLLHDSALTKPNDLGRWLLGAGVIHDALIAPVLVVAGFLTRRLPASARVPVRLGLAATALLVVVTWPLVHAYGVRAANPTVLPHDYGSNVSIAIGAIWITVAAAVGLRHWRRR